MRNLIFALESMFHSPLIFQFLHLEVMACIPERKLVAVILSQFFNISSILYINCSLRCHMFGYVSN